jgi:hypothetical protein
MDCPLSGSQLAALVLLNFSLALVVLAFTAMIVRLITTARALAVMIAARWGTPMVTLAL